MRCGARKSGHLVERLNVDPKKWVPPPRLQDGFVQEFHEAADQELLAPERPQEYRGGGRFDHRFCFSPFDLLAFFLARPSNRARFLLRVKKIPFCFPDCALQAPKPTSLNSKPWTSTELLGHRVRVFNKSFCEARMRTCWGA